MKFLSIIFLSFFLFACNAQDGGTTQVQETVQGEEVITGLYGPEMFQAKMDEIGDYNLVDIRTAGELAENGTMDGALNFDYYSADFKDQISELDKDKALFIYCRSGGRSGNSVPLLQEWGFTEIYDLKGGYNAWLSTYGQ